MFKFSGFSPKANAVINTAMTEASCLGHCFIGTEHILLGMLKEGACENYKAITSGRVTAEGIMEKLLENVGRGAKTNL
ncbi:MAG: hypothetical protein IJE83_02035, partial [Oscillospiraceae bacterium]|nr:hypothetical protein [Oscillospiraceae bacterium]